MLIKNYLLTSSLAGLVIQNLKKNSKQKLEKPVLSCLIDMEKVYV